MLYYPEDFDQDVRIPAEAAVRMTKKSNDDDDDGFDPDDCSQEPENCNQCKKYCTGDNKEACKDEKCTLEGSCCTNPRTLTRTSVFPSRPPCAWPRS